MSPTLLARLDARDRALFARWAFASAPQRWVRLAWRALTQLGGTQCSVAAAALPLLSHGPLTAGAHLAVATLVVSHLLVQLIKRTVGRPRPSRLGFHSLIAEPDRFSFPSGHSAAAMSVAFAYTTAFPIAGVVLIPLAFAVGLSRVCLGVHYPGDVLMGQLIALLSGALVVGL